MAQNVLDQNSDKLENQNTTANKSKLFQAQSLHNTNIQNKDNKVDFPSQDQSLKKSEPDANTSSKIVNVNPSKATEMDNISDRIQNVVDVNLPENRSFKFQQVPGENPVNKSDATLNMDSSIPQSSVENENEMIRKDPEPLFKTHTPEINNKKESQIKYNKLDNAKESSQISIANLFGIDLTAQQPQRHREMSIDCLFGIDLTPR